MTIACSGVKPWKRGIRLIAARKGVTFHGGISIRLGLILPANPVLTKYSPFEHSSQAVDQASELLL